MTNKNYLDNFFHFIARYIIFIPLVIIGLAILFKSNQSSRVSPLVTLATPTPQPTVTMKNDAFKLDLQGPTICGANIKDASIAAFIKNKMVLVDLTQNLKINYFLLNGDCFYMWQDKQVSGSKICGVGQYTSLFEALTKFGGINLGNIMSYLPLLGINKTLPVNQDQIDQIVTSCKKQDFGSQILLIPPGVTFKEQKLNSFINK